MEGNGKGIWDVVSEYPYGTLVISLSLIWSAERVILAMVKLYNAPIVAESEEPNNKAEI